jgi:hypothetical protein
MSIIPSLTAAEYSFGWNILTSAQHRTERLGRRYPPDLGEKYLGKPKVDSRSLQLRESFQRLHVVSRNFCKVHFIVLVAVCLSFPVHYAA